MIDWQQLSGPTCYRSKDRTYSVGEVYDLTFRKVRFRACFLGCLSALPLGENRDTAEEARADADAHWQRLQEATCP